MASPKIRIPDILELIEEHHGNVSLIATAVGCSRPTIYNRINNNPKLLVALDAARERRVDSVEDALFNNAIGGNVAAQIFIMKASPAAKKRGWSDRTEITGADGGPIETRDETVRELSDDDLRRNLETLGRAAAFLAAGGRNELPHDAGDVP